MTKLVILASGRGTNADAILTASENGRLKDLAKTLAVITDNPSAPVIDVAKKHDVFSCYIDPQNRGARFSADAERKYLDFLQSLKPDLVVLAGFMRILPPSIVSAFDGKMINLHPSLLPAYRGKDSIKRAYEAREKFTGCTVHFVSDVLDGGSIIAQTPVEIQPTQTLGEVEANVHRAEHALLVDVIARIAKAK